MMVLALDTAGASCGVALIADGRVRARRRLDMPRGHAEALMPLIGEALAEAGAGYPDLDLIAVTTGPGAFTGLRIGLATAGGLALALGRGIVGVTTLEAHAAAAAGRVSPADAAPAAAAPAVLAAVDSRRGDVFAQLFRPHGPGVDAPAPVRPEGAPFCRDPAGVAGALPPGPAILCGDAAPAVARHFVRRPEVAVFPETAIDPVIVARLGAQRAHEARPDPPPPVYLRPPDARPAPPAPALRP